jgi:CHAT domain-containing protein
MHTTRSACASAPTRGFAPPPASAAEARTVAGLYRRARPDEPVEVWEGADASEARLRARERPPRVLHLATHGFYRPADARRDGVLHATEAQDLDLEGTELVALSACETAQGSIDHGEGVSGLVRALRTAGARRAVVALRPVGDAGAAEFVGRFYRHWLGQSRGDPAAACRAAQLEAMAAAPAGPSRRDQVWAHSVLVGG